MNSTNIAVISTAAGIVAAAFSYWRRPNRRRTARNEKSVVVGLGTATSVLAWLHFAKDPEHFSELLVLGTVEAGFTAALELDDSDELLSFPKRHE